MDPAEYRRDFAAYHSAFEREHFARHSGLAARPDLKPSEERYADLWTREALEDLRLRLDETPAQFETERAALRSLKGAASLKFVEGHALEVSDELRRCEDSARFDWQGQRLSSTDAPELVAAEADASRRHEMAARWFEEVRRCDDLRAARLETLDEASRALGFDNRLALQESINGVSLRSLSAAAEGFLERTGPVYTSHLSRWAARAMPAGTSATLRYADGLSFRRAARLDTYFGGMDFRAVYGETLAGLGVRLGAQPQLRVDDEARPTKSPRTACFAVAPPEDVRLVVGAERGGAEWQRESFREGGRAQVFAWVSRELSARYPEFVYSSDKATPGGHASLFSALLRDAGWLAGQRGLRATEAREAAGFVALVELHDARRECASLRHAAAFADSGASHSSEQWAESYAESHTEATGFRYEAATRLLDADEGIASSSALRARLFAAGLAEHLRSRHGRRWHASRAAGDELRDLWNTGSRYAVEELARLAWGGELSFELLADELIAAVNESDV
jgi:hypothetical protein